MNRKTVSVADAFEGKKAFIGFLTGGDPTMEKCEEYVMNMIEAGCDLVEIGIPFSDPIAEGPVIQAANIRALAAGATVEKLFEMTKRIREKTDIPLVFLTYLNPVFKYGYEKFCRKCRESGVNGLIIPDLPYEEREPLSKIAEGCEVDVISLVAPTSKDRIKVIAKEATGFIYVVSSMGVTGVRNEIETDLSGILQTIRSASKVPAAVGFGISTPAQAEKVAKEADGVIVGSAIVKIIEQHGEEAGTHLTEYVRKMKHAVQHAG